MVKSNTGHIGKFTSKISRRSSIYISRLTNKYGINNTQLLCLVVLYRGDGKTQDFLSEELSLDKAGVTRCVKKLTKGLDEYEKEIALKVLKQVSLNADEAYKNLK